MDDESKDLKKPQVQPPEAAAPDPNPEKVEEADITFFGQDIVGKGDLETTLTDVLKNRGGGWGDDLKEKTLEEEEYARNAEDSIKQAAELMRVAQEKGEEGDLHLALDDSGKLVETAPGAFEVDPFANVPAEQAKPKIDPADDVAKGGANPDDPKGDQAAPDPDPLVMSTVIEMPSTKNGADAYWKLLDATEDAATDFADAVKNAIEDGSFIRVDSPYPPLYCGGDYLAGYDKHDNFILYKTAVKAGSFQSNLSGLRGDIPFFVVYASYLGVSADAQVMMMLVPLFNTVASNSSQTGCCTPKYTELKFTTTISASTVTWTCAQWVGNQYLAMDTSGEHSLRVFYDACGRGWTGVVEPQNMLSVGAEGGYSGDMTDTQSPVGNWTFSGGGAVPTASGDSAADVASAMSYDIHPCDADLVSLNNYGSAGSEYSALLSISTELKIYACS